MKGKIVKYTDNFTKSDKTEYSAIIIDHKNGYYIMKSWSNKTKFIDCPLIKIFWLREPMAKPLSALKRMAIDWNISPQYSFGFSENNNSYIVDGWDEFISEWYYLDTFKVIK